MQALRGQKHVFSFRGQPIVVDESELPSVMAQSRALYNDIADVAISRMTSRQHAVLQFPSRPAVEVPKQEERQQQGVPTCAMILSSVVAILLAANLAPEAVVRYMAEFAAVVGLCGVAYKNRAAVIGRLFPKPKERN